MATTMEQIQQNIDNLKGRIKTEGVTDNSGKVLLAPDNTINSAVLKGSQGMVTLPEQKTDNTNYNQYLNFNLPKETPQKESDIPEYLKAYLQGSNPMPSMAGDYQAGLSALQPFEADIRAKQEATTSAKRQVDLINSQIKGITDSATQANLQLEQQAGGKDVTTSFLGRQQQEINRQAAIQSLPLQSQALVAQANLVASQGDTQTAQLALQQAQQKIDTLFQIKQQDAKNQYDWEQSILDKTYDYGTTQDKNKLDEARLKQEQDFTFKQNELNRQHQTDLQNLKFQQDLTLKGATDTVPTIKAINGVDMQWNPTTKSWDKVNIGSSGNVSSLSQDQGDINQVSDLLKSGGLSTSVGTNFLTRTPSSTGFFAPLWTTLKNIAKIPLTLGVGTVKDIKSSITGDQQNFVAGVSQLQSQLSLDSLINAKAKGATFGALSDREMDILSKSASKIGSWEVKDNSGKVVGYNTTQKAFKAELERINNFAKLDYLLKGGNPEDVGVQLKDDGTYWTQNSDGSYTQLQ